MATKMDCYGITDIGKKRTMNEDQFLIADLNKSLNVHQTSLGLDHKTRLFSGSQGKLLVVADGMGGHEAGERASTVAIDGIAHYVLNTMHWLFRLEEESDEDFEVDLKAAMEYCQSKLTDEVEVIPQRRGMGTTLTMAYVIWPRLYLVHVGDSRCYLHRNSILKQLTRDHTMEQLHNEHPAEAVESDSPSDAKTSRMRHVLWNVVGGTSDELTPEVYRADLVPGDTLLLCTDGLTNHVSDAEIKRQLEGDHSAKEICQTLVAEANDRGGRDNITIILARFKNSPSQREDEEDAEAAAGDEATTIDQLADTDPHMNVARLVRSNK